MKGQIEPASVLAETGQPLVDYFTALADRFSLSIPVRFVLY
jgi:hypothetical protein